jgi:hypothetical protein
MRWKAIEKRKAQNKNRCARSRRGLNFRFELFLYWEAAGMATTRNDLKKCSPADSKICLP